MKTIHKALLALGALLGVVALGLFWLVRGALGVADHAVDAAANGVDRLTAVAAKQTTRIAQAAKAEVRDTNKDAEPAKDAAASASDDTVKTSDTPTMPAIALPTDGGRNAGNGAQSASAQKPAAKKNENAVDEDLADVGQLFKMLLSEGDDSDGDAVPALPGAADKGGSDDLTSLVPGGDSPTLRGVMAGKYKGNASKIIDDALEDPKAWRLLFFLGGGM